MDDEAAEEDRDSHFVSLLACDEGERDRERVGEVGERVRR